MLEIRLIQRADRARNNGLALLILAVNVSTWRIEQFSHCSVVVFEHRNGKRR